MFRVHSRHVNILISRVVIATHYISKTILQRTHVHAISHHGSILQAKILSNKIIFNQFNKKNSFQYIFYSYCRKHQTLKTYFLEDILKLWPL